MASPGYACGDIVWREANHLFAGLRGYCKAEVVRSIERSHWEGCHDDDSAFVDIDRLVGKCRFEGYRARINDPLRYEARKCNARRNQIIVRGRVRIDVVTGVNPQRDEEVIARPAGGHVNVIFGARIPGRLVWGISEHARCVEAAGR